MNEENLSSDIDLDTSKLSGEFCPRCAERGQVVEMVIYSEGTSPDDYDTGLICPNCFYFERD